MSKKRPSISPRDIDEMEEGRTPRAQLTCTHDDAGRLDDLWAFNVSIHMERLGPELVWLGIRDADTGEQLVHIILNATKRGRLQYRADREIPMHHEAAGSSHD